MKKISLTTITCLALFISAFSFKSYSQALTSEDIKTFMIKEWERAKAYTTEYLNTMPADKYSLKPVDSIRSFAMQMLHLASGNVFLMSNATDQALPKWLRQDLENSPTAQTKDSVAYFVNASYDFCINAVKSTDVSKWGEKKRIFGMETTRFGLITKTFEHQTHHRGQTTIYIRLAGIKPPQEKLF